MMAATRGDANQVLPNLKMAETLGLSASEPSACVIRAGVMLAFGQWEPAAAQLTTAMPEPFRARGGEVARLVCRAAFDLADKREAARAVAALAGSIESQGGLVRHHVMTGLLVTWLARLSAVDDAFDLAGRIVATWRATGRLPTLALFFLWYAGMADFRADPRFQALCADLDLPEYWERHGPPDGYRLVDGAIVPA